MNKFEGFLEDIIETNILKSKKLTLLSRPKTLQLQRVLKLQRLISFFNRLHPIICIKLLNRIFDNLKNLTFLLILLIKDNFLIFNSEQHISKIMNNNKPIFRLIDNNEQEHLVFILRVERLCMKKIVITLSYLNC